jgi:hypothetical protein
MMRSIFTLLSILWFFAADAQQLTGIWRGYFSSSNGLFREDMREEMYKYEVQINQLPNNALEGVTYSYKSTVFYGKASLQGIYTVQTKNLILKETKLVELRIGDRSEPCLMTCYLEYSKIGSLEVLQGTFISINANSKADCGSGKVYLERVPESDFGREEFLRKKRWPEAETLKLSKIIAPGKTNRNKNSVDLNAGKKAESQASVSAKRPPASSNTRSDNTATNKPLLKNTPAQRVTIAPNKDTKPTTGKQPAATGNAAVQSTNTAANKTTTTAKGKQQPAVAAPLVAPPPPPVKPADTWKPDASSNVKRDTIPTARKESMPNRGPVPRVLMERENNLVKTIYTNERQLLIEIYDNGTIDNDTVSLYHNNQLVISHGKLSYSPLSFKVKCDNNESRHELILVAENLGEIPPNTALMVITAGKKRYEIFLTSNEQRNAKVVIEYKE